MRRRKGKKEVVGKIGRKIGRKQKERDTQERDVKGGRVRGKKGGEKREAGVRMRKEKRQR